MGDEEILKQMEQANSTDEVKNLFEKLSVEGKKITEEKINQTLADDICQFIVPEIEKFNIEESEFLAEHQRIWGEGFKYSRFLYQVIVEAEIANKKIIESIPKEEFQKKEYLHQTIKALFARALQQYGEVLTLVENGFPDGAYARTRSLYEIMLIASFIVEQENSEDVAKAYFKQSMNSKASTFEWARTANCFSGFPTKKNINLELIGKNSSIRIKYFLIEIRYKLANSLIHAYPESTFGRLGGHGTKQFGQDPVGRSHFCIAEPVMDATNWLIEISMYFFNLFPEHDDGLKLQNVRALSIRILQIYKSISEENEL